MAKNIDKEKNKKVVEESKKTVVADGDLDIDDKDEDKDEEDAAGADDDIPEVSEDQVEQMGGDDMDDDEDEDDAGTDENEEEDIPEVPETDVEHMSDDSDDDDGDDGMGDDEDEEDAGDDMDGDGLDDEDEEDAGDDDEDDIPEVSEDDVTPVSADDDKDDDDEDEEDEEDAGDDEDEDDDKDDDKKDDAEQPPVQASTPDMIIEPIFEKDIDMKSANLEMVLFNETTENPHWTVFNNGKPVAEIALASQEDPEAARENFISEGYSQSLLENMRALAAAKTPTSPVEVLKQVKAKFYHAAVRTADLARKMETEASEGATSRIAKANDNYNERLTDNMNLVVAKQVKNLYKEPDPFKVNLISAIKKAGVEHHAAVEIVETAFIENGPDWFKRVVAKAHEYCAMTPDALKEIKAELDGSNLKEVDYDVIEERDNQRTAAATPDRKAPSRGVPLETYTKAPVKTAGTEGGDMRDRFRGNLRGIRRGR